MGSASLSHRPALPIPNGAAPRSSTPSTRHRTEILDLSCTGDRCVHTQGC